MSDPNWEVSCQTHGKSFATYLCQHLADATGIGFFHAESSDIDPFPDAWCVECEEILQKEGEWTDSALKTANFRLVCAHCYPRARRHARQYVLH